MRRKKGELTRGEEEVMHHIWNLKEATVNDIVENMADPKPKYTTVATFIKLLENKGFVDHSLVGHHLSSSSVTLLKVLFLNKRQIKNISSGAITK